MVFCGSQLNAQRFSRRVTLTSLRGYKISFLLRSPSNLIASWTILSLIMAFKICSSIPHTTFGNTIECIDLLIPLSLLPELVTCDLIGLNLLTSALSSRFYLLPFVVVGDPPPPPPPPDNNKDSDFGDDDNRGFNLIADDVDPLVSLTLSSMLAPQSSSGNKRDEIIDFNFGDCDADPSISKSPPPDNDKRFNLIVDDVDPLNSLTLTSILAPLPSPGNNKDRSLVDIELLVLLTPQLLTIPDKSNFDEDSFVFLPPTTSRTGDFKAGTFLRRTGDTIHVLVVSFFLVTLVISINVVQLSFFMFIYTQFE